MVSNLCVMLSTSKIENQIEKSVTVLERRGLFLCKSLSNKEEKLTYIYELNTDPKVTGKHFLCLSFLLEPSGGHLTCLSSAVNLFPPPQGETVPSPTEKSAGVLKTICYMFSEKQKKDYEKFM